MTIPSMRSGTGSVSILFSARKVSQIESSAIRKLAESDPALSGLLHPALPYRTAEVVWAVRSEMARTVEDVLARRTRALFLDARAAVAMAPRVAELLAAELGHDAAWQADQVRAFEAVARGYCLS